MAEFTVFFRTSGFAKAFVGTTGSSPFVLTSPAARAFFTTAANYPVVYTAPKKVAFFVTASTSPIVKTTGKNVIFVVTPDFNTPRELDLKIGTLVFDTNQTTVDVPDATGEYNAITNPGGYNPEAASTLPFSPLKISFFILSCRAT